MKSFDDINDTLRKEGPDGVRARHDRARKYEVKATRKHRRNDGAADSDHAPPEFSDEALALHFAERHQHDLRYVAAWNKWLGWDGARWRFDNTLFAFDLARIICRQAASGCKTARIAAALASAKTVAAVERLAKADRRLAATVDQWDADPWLLNTPAGIVDLRSGEMRRHRPEDYMTKVTGTAPDTACPTSLWDATIRRATGGDEALAGYLKRLFGYALTGSTREHSLHFAYGTGANSKSTLLNTVAGCLGDYHTAAPIETFTSSSVDRHPTDLADLRGARMVTASETEEGRRWAESRIKTLTGGDRVKARFMKQDFFEYIPQFTLIIFGNHKPGLRSVDEAIRRRFHLIPFTVTIPPHERDRELGEKLKAEWPGILDWCIGGCLAWQQQGLDPPNAVIDATATYLESQDAHAAWIEERCTRNPHSWESRSALFGSWVAWATATGEPVGTRANFLEALESKGLQPAKRHGTRGLRGIELRQDWQGALGAPFQD